MTLQQKLTAILLLVFLAFAASAGQTNTTIQSNRRTPDQSGRWKFLVGTTLLGFTVWGGAARFIWFDPIEEDSFDSDDFIKGIGAYLLTVSASYFVPSLLTKESRLTKGMSTFALFGGYKGVIDGLLIHAIITDDEDDPQGMFAAMALGSIGELLIHYRIAEKHDYSHSKARLLNSLSLMGYINHLRTKSPARSKDSAFQLHINPMALLSGLNQKERHPDFSSIPVVTAGFSF